MVTYHDIVTKIYQAEFSQSNKSKMVIYASMPWVTSVMKQWGQGGRFLVDSLGICFVSLNESHLDSIISVSRSSRTLHFPTNSIGLLLVEKKARCYYDQWKCQYQIDFSRFSNAPFDPLITTGNHSDKSICWPPETI